jgi:hypothetical protein
MYAHLHIFQQMTTTIIEQHSMVQAKNTQLITIREGLGEVDRWIIENPDAPWSNFLTPQEYKEILIMLRLTTVNKLGREQTKR